MSELSLLKQVALFAALEEGELQQVAAIGNDAEVGPNELIFRQNTTGTEMVVIAEGSVDVFIEGVNDSRSLIVLGKGQVVGEMALIDYGYRSASVRSTKEGCRYTVIERDEFIALCQKNTRIGFIVMRNLAIDLAFKLRHRNLTEM
jgi:CRP-like cAMP-binding protein